ncbi:hypothetical protein [Mycobacterium shigaense]|uniref:Uncharacterized protein n=1 Tax=Mycobacterium shigaense TaxID=722731 RepID=A0A1Z4EKC7_9MYCO|nr:hypothetical protein [Mycobacterium shigaense]BAX93376.1 hypothetical protein MSG_03238 [Mycobacterium shigaense]
MPDSLVVARFECDDQRMDMMAMGLMGTVVGASAVGIAGIAKSATDTLLPGMVGSSHNRHQTRIHLHTRRCDTVHHWRNGLAQARDVYRRWEGGPRTDGPPNVVGDEWFEGLRPNLSATGDAAKFRTAHEVHCDNPTLTLLSLEIGRIEKEWADEVKGRRRRRR